MIHVDKLIVPIPIKVEYIREKKFRQYSDSRSFLMDENRNPIKVYWDIEQTEQKSTISYNNIEISFADLFQKFISKGEDEFPYRGVHMTMEIVNYNGITNETPEYYLAFSFEAYNKNIFDNIYFAIRDWLCDVFKCEPFIF